MVTPLESGGGIDHGALAALCEAQVAAGVAGLAPVGSTGEGGLLTAGERRAVLTTVVRAVAGRLPVMPGTGCQSTWETCERQREALDLGAACGLVVAPFYCRPTQAELVHHFRAVARAVPLPTVLYNVPRRTGCDLGPAAAAALADEANIVGIKEATGELDRVGALRRAAPHWRLFSGDDASFAAFVAAGGDGVISVASNISPAAMVAACAAAGGGAADAHPPALAALLRRLAAGPNPQTIKGMMAEAGLIAAGLRAPLMPAAAPPPPSWG